MPTTLPTESREESVPAATHQRPPGSKSHAAILEAATEEFIARGFDGVRMEHVAKRAGFNKALVYKHFRDRKGLFQAVLESAIAGRRVVLDHEPRDLGEAMIAWSDAAFSAPDYGKLLMREALEHGRDAPVLAAERSAYYARQVAGVAQAQSLGRLPAGLDPRFLFLALMSVVTLPSLLPQAAGLATGEDPAGDAFQAGWRAFLAAFADALASSQPED